LAIIASVWAILTPRPDVLISADGQTAAVRAATGQLTLLHTGRDTFAVKEWLAADADARDTKDASLANGMRCDQIGCAAALKNGRLVTMALATEAFAEDCARAAVVISPRQNYLPCSTHLIDRPVWRAHGSIALRWLGDRFEQIEAQPSGYDRPWAPVREIQRTEPASAPQDATPRAEDLEPGD
jgi:competence protein ComEC